MTDTERAQPCQSWKPIEHVDHACTLADEADRAAGDHGKFLALLGQLHVQIAQAKMTGSGRVQR